eukprot:scaffold133437_cov84-Phaeocystis_antarctica.AAC.2
MACEPEGRREAVIYARWAPPEVPRRLPSSVCVIDAVSPAFSAAKATAPVHTRHNCQLTLRHPFLWKRSLSYILVITVR